MVDPEIRDRLLGTGYTNRLGEVYDDFTYTRNVLIGYYEWRLGCR